jgi:hypothetical protein
VNANDATLTELATAQSGSMVADNAPNAPASASFDLVLEAAAGSALGSSGAPYTLTISAIDLTAVSQPWPAQILHQAFDTASGWKLSGTGPDYECTQTFPVPVPGDGPGGPLAGHHRNPVRHLKGNASQLASYQEDGPVGAITQFRGAYGKWAADLAAKKQESDREVELARIARAPRSPTCPGDVGGGYAIAFIKEP